VNGGRLRNYPWHDRGKWELFKQYCKNDVEAEREAHRKMSRFPVPESEWSLWRLDQIINNRGMRVDLDFVDKAIEIDAQMRKYLTAEAKRLTRLSNPNSIKQLMAWLNKNMEEDVESLTKDVVKELIQITDDETVSRVLEIRQELSKTSIKKYAALKGATCSDERIRGTLLFYGASRTGRDAGRVFQPQNLPQNHLYDLEGARWLVKHTDLGTVEFIYDSVSDTLSQLIRTAIVPAEGKKFIVADYSAVEARALAWMADEKWRIDVFNTHGKIYEASASAAFHVPMDQIDKGSPLRQQGKVLELACGYGGSVGAIDSMDRNKAIPEEDRKPMVDAWRRASPNIVSFWWKMGDAAVYATENPGVRVDVQKGVYFIRENNFLFMGLPSGRRLAYPRPMMADGKYGPKLTYDGQDQKTNKWSRIDTYGPKLVENLIQALCRDLLFHGVSELEKEGHPVILRVHDEVVVEVDLSVTVEEVCKVFERKPKWAQGMPHRADGFEATFYKKD
jgi:DNA polymerase